MKKRRRRSKSNRKHQAALVKRQKWQNKRRRAIEAVYRITRYLRAGARCAGAAIARQQNGDAARWRNGAHRAGGGISGCMRINAGVLRGTYLRF
jgi:hypothetical protein